MCLATLLRFGGSGRWRKRLKPRRARVRISRGPRANGSPSAYRGYTGAIQGVYRGHLHCERVGSAMLRDVPGDQTVVVGAARGTGGVERVERVAPSKHGAGVKGIAAGRSAALRCRELPIGARKALL